MTYALYYELTSGKSVRQNIFSPATPLGKDLLLPVYWSRTVSSDQPRRTWSRVVRDGYEKYSSKPFASMASAIEYELKQLEGLSSHMKEPLTNPDYNLVVAFPVLLSDSAKLEILEIQKARSSRVPTSLLTQIRVQRAALDLTSLPGDV